VEEVFNIARISFTEVKELSVSYNEPHVHEHEELIVGIDGEIEHFIDFRSQKLSAPFISFIAQGKPHVVKTMPAGGKFEGYLITFKSEFIAETTFQLYSYYHNNSNILFQPGHGFCRMPLLCDIMDDEMKQPSPDFSVIRQILNALFTIIESERKRTVTDEGDLVHTRNVTFTNFLRILEDNFRRPLGVDFYAEKLFMSARNLNLICKNIFQKSVTEIIETRKLIEAKNLLMNSDKTVSEIGFELGFNEKAYFTNVFKKRTGQTPTEFREEMKKLIS
jgi:AraC family transcriptional regulator, transcriptional activator of pobA